METDRKTMRKALCLAISGYQRYLSPWLPPHCRYHPSCSQYMFEAIQIHGACHGVWLGLKRLSRCNPLGSHGFDPVPAKSEAKTNKIPPTKEAPPVSRVENIKINNSNRRGSLNG